MAKYKIHTNQNIFDVALHLYGSIEGVFDLLITNTKLSMSSDLVAGEELEYHPDFVINGDVVENMKVQNIIPSNSERHVYFKESRYPIVAVCRIDPIMSVIQLVVGGEGIMEFDWGDNTDIESIALTHRPQTIRHYFNNTVESRCVKIYGNFKLTQFDTSDLHGEMLLIRPITVDEYKNCANGMKLSALFLFEGTYKVNLYRCNISDLSPIGDMSLQELDLRGVAFKSVDVLDDYLEYIVNNYGSRRNCTVYLDTEPTERGMKAVNTIINEAAWNQSGKWVFNIKDKIYTA